MRYYGVLPNTKHPEALARPPKHVKYTGHQPSLDYVQRLLTHRSTGDAASPRTGRDQGRDPPSHCGVLARRRKRAHHLNRDAASRRSGELAAARAREERVWLQRRAARRGSRGSQGAPPARVLPRVLPRVPPRRRLVDPRRRSGCGGRRRRRRPRQGVRCLGLLPRRLADDLVRLSRELQHASRLEHVDREVGDVDLRRRERRAGG